MIDESIYKKRYYQNHREERLAYQREYKKTHPVSPEKEREYNKRYSMKNDRTEYFKSLYDVRRNKTIADRLRLYFTDAKFRKEINKISRERDCSIIELVNTCIFARRYNEFVRNYCIDRKE